MCFKINRIKLQNGRKHTSTEKSETCTELFLSKKQSNLDKISECLKDREQIRQEMKILLEVNCRTKKDTGFSTMEKPLYNLDVINFHLRFLIHANSTVTYSYSLGWYSFKLRETNF